MPTAPQSIGRRRAIALADSGWWEGRAAREVAKFQLLTRELCMPFAVFHRALEEALGRPVWVHEFGFSYDALVQELFGERDAPTWEEIVALLPAAKRFLVEWGDGDE